jgi:hypothetical protein
MSGVHYPVQNFSEADLKRLFDAVEARESYLRDIRMKAPELFEQIVNVSSHYRKIKESLAIYIGEAQEMYHEEDADD